MAAVVTRSQERSGWLGQSAFLQEVSVCSSWGRGIPRTYRLDVNLIAAIVIDAPIMIFQKSALFLPALYRRFGILSLPSTSSRVAPTSRTVGIPRARSNSIQFLRSFLFYPICWVCAHGGFGNSLPEPLSTSDRRLYPAQSHCRSARGCVPACAATVR